MITGLNDSESRLRAMEAGADDFLAKPLDIFEMGVRVKSLLRIKFYHDDLAQSIQTIAAKNRRLQELECVKESLIHMIIHDMRGPLTGVYGKLQILQLEQALAADHRTEVDACLAHCQRLNAMIEEMLDIHQYGSAISGTRHVGRRQSVGNRAQRPVMFPERHPGKENSCGTEFAGRTAGRCLPTPDLICRVLTNLVDNAVRVTPANGSL